MFKVKKGIATSLLQEVFQIAYLNYNLENKREFKSRNVKTVFFGTESLAFLCLKILDNSFQFIRDEFKWNVKNWVPQDWPCRLCKIYIHDVGFI